MSQPPVILSIAGYDPSSGAGITADIKTAAAQNCYAVTCITALTVQSTQGVSGVQPLAPDLVARTLATLADDLEIAAVRVGMLGSGAVAATVADFLEERRLPNVVLDPVIRSSSGNSLLDEAGLDVLVMRLLPLCDVITPNIDEAARLTGAEPLAANTPWEEALPRLRAMAGGFATSAAGRWSSLAGTCDRPTTIFSTGGASRSWRKSSLERIWNPDRPTGQDAPLQPQSLASWRTEIHCRRRFEPRRNTFGRRSSARIRLGKAAGLSITGCECR